MTTFGNSAPKGRRAAPRIQVPLVVELSIGGTKQRATLTEISRTGAKLNGVGPLTVDQDLEFRAGTVRACGAVVWFDGNECAIEFDTPLAVAEVGRLRVLADFVTGTSTKGS